VQLAAPAAAKVPAPQIVATPLLQLKPGGQVTPVLDVEPAGQYMPGATAPPLQALHEGEPSVLKKPWAHNTQKFCPAAAKEPAGHCVHLPAKAVSKKWPPKHDGWPDMTMLFETAPRAITGELVRVGEPRKKQRLPAGLVAIAAGAIKTRVAIVFNTYAVVGPALPPVNAWTHDTAGVVKEGAPDIRLAGVPGAPENRAV